MNADQDTLGRTCGVDGHDPACLCDVKFNREVEIRYGLHEFRGAPYVMKKLHVGYPFTSKDLANVFRYLLEVHDEVNCRFKTDNTPGVYHVALRKQLLCYHRSGHGTIDGGMEKFGLSFPDWRVTVLRHPTQGDDSNPFLRMAKETWVDLERRFTAGEVTSWRELADEFQVDEHKLARSLAPLMGWRLAGYTPRPARLSVEAQARRDELCRTDLTATVIAKMIFDEFGESTTRKAVVHRRTWLQKNGMLNV